MERSGALLTENKPNPDHHFYKYINIFPFFSSNIRMSGKNVNFGDKKIKKSYFYKNNKVAKIDDIDVNKIWSLKKNQLVRKIHLNALLDAMIIMLLDHYT